MSDVATSGCRLAVYGSLGPGKANHHQLDMLRGVWVQGRVRGRLVRAGWGDALGFPGLELDDAEALIDVEVLESPDLPHHWNRLDAFEGPGYRRAVTEVQTLTGTLQANIYVLAQG